MQAKQVANDADWVSIKATCDAYLNAKVFYPDIFGLSGSGIQVPGTTGTNANGGLGDGGMFAGDQYYNGVTALSACYQALFPSNATAARVYSSKAQEVLLAITSPALIMTKGSTPFVIVPTNAGNTRTKSGETYVFHWSAGNSGVSVSDTVTISGAVGCTNINGTYTVSNVGGNTLAFTGAPATANADCGNYNWNYSQDSNFGARYYGRALARLYDWINPELSGGNSTSLTMTMTNFSAEISRNGYGSGHPESNYAASWVDFFAHCYAAWSGDNATLSNFCQTAWNAALLGSHKKRDYYNLWMAGGGDGEGLAAYGFGSIAHHVEGVMILRVLGTDLTQSPYNFNYVEDQAKYFLMATKPDRVALDEQEYVFFDNTSTLATNPTVFIPETMYTIGWAARRQSSTYAPYFQSLIQYYETNSGVAADPTDRFLFYSATAPTSDPTTLPLSYSSWGGNLRTARSVWGTSSVSVEFQGGPSTGDAGNGKTQWESGALGIWTGANSVLVLGMGEASRSFDVINDTNFANLNNERSSYFNHKVSGFAADRPAANFTKIDGLAAPAGAPPGQDNTITTYPTKIDLAEEGGGYYYAHSTSIKSTNPPSNVDAATHVLTWDRHMLFIRPKLVVVYDPTTVRNSDDDRAILWAFGRNISEVSGPAGMHTFQAVTLASAFKAQMTTVLPASNSTSIVNHCILAITGSGASAAATCAAGALNYLYRVEVRPSALNHVSDNYLTVLDMSASSGTVSSVSNLTSTSNIDGVQLTGFVAGFAQGGTVTLPMSYSFTAATSQHYVAGMAVSTAYHVTVTSTSVTIATATGSGDTTSSAAGVLAFTSTGPGSGGSSAFGPVRQAGPVTKF